MTTTSTAIAPPTSGIATGWTFTEAQKTLLKNMYAKKCTDDEFATFLHLAQTYQLDPIAREIWCIKLKDGDPALIMTSRDGYLRIAQRDPSFIGLHAAAVREGDHFEFEPATGNVIHKFGAKRGPLVGAWAIAKHALREPVARFVDIREYNKGVNAWATYPSVMIEKVAETIVLKRQFGINGITTREEMDAGAIETEYTVVAPESQTRGQLVADACRATNGRVSRAVLEAIRSADFADENGNPRPFDDLEPDEFGALINHIANYKPTGA
jgi:phage recombination protein Bet